LPKSNNGIEIDVGSGRFAAPLGIKVGIDPSSEMRDVAQKSWNLAKKLYPIRNALI
jgi:hypothetical protein